MIISVEKLKKYSAFDSMNTMELMDELDGIESIIRSYTNNNFQNRNVRIYAPSESNCLVGHSPYLKVGDTIEISNSNVNDGLYVITKIDSNSIQLDKDIYDVSNQTVTKVEYPQAVQNVVIKLLSWKVQSGSKVGVASETIGRHSVSYVQQNDSNSYYGYPMSLLAPLNQYHKASRNYRSKLW